MSQDHDLSFSDNQLRCVWAQALIHDQRVNNWTFNEFPQIGVNRQGKAFEVTLRVASGALVSRTIGGRQAGALTSCLLHQKPLPAEFLSSVCRDVRQLELANSQLKAAPKRRAG